ncbi:phenylacetate--CoA ligase family protein [Dokdonella sp.]|uniref:phenylacetate--CoA ligase family protein n=1 Tax=Dokdonella sp. TaxID=2291710 RepID=UPI0035280689
MSSLYETAFRRVLFPLYESGLRRRPTLAYMKEYEQNQWLSSSELAELQWGKLKRLIEHCWRDVPYYQRRWKELGVTPDDLQSFDDYARLPILNKAEIRANFEDLHATSLRKGLLYKTTGGSTGEPLRFGYTRESYERRTAVMWRGYSWAGARMGRRMLYLWGMLIGDPSLTHRIKESIYHYAFNRYMLNAFLMSEERMPEYVERFNRYRPEVVVGYAGPLLRMAEWIRDRKPPIHQPQAILSAAEALHNAQREVIEKAFGCPVFNTYGCREVMLIASQCEQRDGLHLSADHLRVELESLQTSPSGEHIGEVVLTDLHNYGMPLLRYANGDLATAADGPCGCGRGLPRVRRIDGRKLDTLRTPAGHLLPGEYIVYAFLGIASIKHYQVVQRELSALDVNLVPDSGFGEHTRQQIRAELAKVVGDSVSIRFHEVDQIVASPSGKFRVAICELGQDATTS